MTDSRTIPHGTDPADATLLVRSAGWRHVLLPVVLFEIGLLILIEGGALWPLDIVDLVYWDWGDSVCQVLVPQ